MEQRRFFDLQKVCNHAAVLVLGLFAGAMLMAAWQGLGQGTLVHATATHGQNNFAIATGFVDDSVEAFYFLDFLTGDLRAAAVSRRTGEFVALFERNIQQDFAGGSKNPKYLMVTGLANIPRGRGTQLGNSLIYIAEASSGEVAAYALPWNASLHAKGQPQRGNFVPLAKGSFRTTFVRDE
ncbi:MAG: hypothetical protein AAGD11_09015 [Planctomycetota bacterium]